MGRRASKSTAASKSAQRPASGRIAKAAVKQAAAKSGTVKRIRMTPERRREMIAEAAYYRAQKRQFEGGNPLEDWLMAEAEIDRAMRLRCRAARN